MNLSQEEIHQQRMIRIAARGAAANKVLFALNIGRMMSETIRSFELMAVNLCTVLHCSVAGDIDLVNNQELLAACAMLIDTMERADNALTGGSNSVNNPLLKEALEKAEEYRDTELARWRERFAIASDPDFA